MCDGTGGFMASMGGAGNVAQMAGTAFGGFSQMAQASAQSKAMELDAAAERTAAMEHAQKIRRATRREVGAARAGIAGSGTALDEFSTINTSDIELLGESDAMNTILTGSRRAGTLEQQASLTGAAGRNGMVGSLLTAGGQGYSGWKGAKKAATDPLSRYTAGNSGSGD